MTIICKSCHKNPIAIGRSKRCCVECLDKHSKYMNSFYHKNKTKISAQMKDYYSRRKDRIKLSTKKNRPIREEKLMKIGMCLSCGQNPINFSRSKIRCSECLDIRIHDAKLRNYKKRHAGGTHSLQEWKDLLVKFGNKCLWCGSKESIQRDHIVPIAKGGDNRIQNIQPLCGTCNEKKRVKIIDFRPFGDWILEWT